MYSRLKCEAAIFFYVLICETVKTCPVCKKDYSDELNYCLDDGSPLSGAPTYELTNRPTEVLRQTTNQPPDISNAETVVSDSGKISSTPRTTPSTQTAFKVSAIEPASRMGCVLTVGQVAAALTVVVGLGIVGWLYTSRSYETAGVNPAYSNSLAKPVGNVASNSIKPADSGIQTPVAMATSTPSVDIGRPAVNGGQTLSGGVLNEKATSLPAPPYPPAARAVRASGTVTVQVLVDENGLVVSANATSGHPLLRAAAVHAARAAKFKPTRLGDKPVKVSGIIKYEFALPDAVANRN